MRCPKCGYISFDHLVSCGKCSHDLADVSAMLKGTGFRSLGTFFLSGLIPDYADTAAITPPPGGFPDFDQEIPDLPVAEDLGDPTGLDIDVSELEALGDLPDLPDDESTVIVDDLALDGLEVPEVDLSQFDGESGSEDELSLDDHDVPDMDLDAIDLDVHADLASDDVSTSEVAEAESDPEEDTLFEVEMESGGEAGVDPAAPITDEEPDLVLDSSASADQEELPEANVSLADIDLSLGEDDQSEVVDEDEVMDLADLDLGDVALDLDLDGESMVEGKAKPEEELPDLELE